MIANKHKIEKPNIYFYSNLYGFIAFSKVKKSYIVRKLSFKRLYKILAGLLALSSKI